MGPGWTRLIAKWEYEKGDDDDVDVVDDDDDLLTKIFMHTHPNFLLCLS